jgi:hypothetical protein
VRLIDIEGEDRAVSIARLAEQDVEAVAEPLAEAESPTEPESPIEAESTEPEPPSEE